MKFPPDIAHQKLSKSIQFLQSDSKINGGRGSFFEPRCITQCVCRKQMCQRCVSGTHRRYATAATAAATISDNVHVQSLRKSGSAQASISRCWSNVDHFARVTVCSIRLAQRYHYRHHPAPNAGQSNVHLLTI